MRCFINTNTDVFYNFAVEEYFVNNYEESVFIIWKNTPNVMIGRNQNTINEINMDFCEKNNIKIVRRLSGGGAVFSSPENFQYTLIVDKNEIDGHGFKDMAEPLINFLEELGIDAEFTGRNDILIDGKKISGNAQYNYKNILLHHGTILFDVNVDMLTKALTPDPTKLTAKGIKSVKSRITTIKEKLKDYDVDRFMSEFMEYQLNNKLNYLKELTEEEKDKALKIKKERWDLWDWNFGKNPKFSNLVKRKFDSGLVEINYEVKLAKIEKIKIYGDFFSTLDIVELENLFLNQKFEKENIAEKLKNINISKYINGVNNDEFINLMFE